MIENSSSIGKTDLSSYCNDEYRQYLPNVLKRFAWYWVNIFIFQTSIFPSYPLKRYFLRLFGAKVGVGVVVKPSVNIKYPWNLVIGNYSWIGEGVWIDSLGKIQIGEHVCVSQGVYLLTGNHDYTSSNFNLFIKPITLKDGCWIGAKAIVCPGVICDSHSVLSVGSVATKRLESYSIYQGNPAEFVKKRCIT